MHAVARLVRGFGALSLVLGLALLTNPVDAQEARVESVTVSEADRTVVLTLDRAAQGTAVSSFTMTDPNRVIVDIADAQLATGVGTVGVSGGLVERIESESFDDGKGLITRVRIYLTQAAEPRVVTEGGTIRVVLDPAGQTEDPIARVLPGGGASASASSGGSSSAVYTVPGQYTQASDNAGGLPSGPCLSGTGCDDAALPSGPRIKALDFNHDDSTSRVVIGLVGSPETKASQPSSNLIVVDIPRAFVPESLRRVVDTSQFYSPVSSVRAYPTSTGARVAINLRSATQYELRTGSDGELIVEVAVPPYMRTEAEAGRQGFSEVSPSGPADESLKSAYANELYIGSGGQTQQPQSAFNQGVGVGDPSSMLGMSGGFMVDQSATTQASYTGRKISLDFVNADIHSIFRLISSVSRLNIVAGDDVKGNVTVRLEGVPWDQALAAILQAKGLGSQRYGNIVRVAPIETIKAEQQAKVESKRAIEELKEINMMVIPLNYATGSSITEQLRKMVTAKGSVEVDTRTNQIIVRETDDRLAQIRELVRQLDLNTPQVLIEARVVEANANFTRSMGIQWGGSFDASTTTGYPTGLFFPNSVRTNGGISTQGGEVFFSEAQAGESLLVDLGSPAGSAGAINLSLGSIPGLIDLDARLSAIESEGWGKVVSSPRVTTVDNEEAKIVQGTRIPYLSTSAGGTQVQFIEAALELSVTPHVTSDNKIFMKVEVTNNRADFAQQVQGQPAIIIKEASTEVLVANGDTTVIGGVFSTEESRSNTRVPGFSKIPLLGYLFRNSSVTDSRNELLVFITPHIVTRGG